MNTRDVVKRIYDYADVVQKKNDEYFTRNGFTHSPSDKIEVKLGRKYAKVIKLSRHYVAQTSDKVIETRSGGSVHGNIFDEDYGASVVNEHGANYKYNI